MLAYAGSPKALDVHGFSFDSVDRCFAALAATAFVGLVAIVMWVWLTAPSPKALHLHNTATSERPLGHADMTRFDFIVFAAVCSTALVTVLIRLVG